MDIINSTPYRFYTGRRYSGQSLVDAAGKILEEDTSILYVGG